MIDTQTGFAARPFGLALSLAILLPGAAQAAELAFPKDRPEVVLTVPDDWVVKNDAGGLELSSPEKNSIVVGRVIGHDKAFVEKWAKEATGRLQAFGIAFDEKGKPPPSAGVATIGGTGAGNFTFSGAPSLAPPGEASSNNPAKPFDNSLEALTGIGATPGGATPAVAKSKLSFKAVQYYGTSMREKPVDVQLVIYNLPANRLFVMMQESGPDDGRAVAIAQSVKGAKGK